MEDAGRWFVRYRGAQRACEPLFVCVGQRQPEDPVPVPTCGQRVDQWLNCDGIVANE